MYSYRLMVKSVSCYCVRGSRLFSDLVTYTICDGRRTKTVHINRLRPRLQFNTDVNITTTDNQQPPHQPWKPPTVEHFIYTDTSPYPRYPTRIRRPPDHYQP